MTGDEGYKAEGKRKAGDWGKPVSKFQKESEWITERGNGFAVS